MNVPPSPAVVERFRPDVIHFPSQRGFQTQHPYIYQPHDLQHEHFPGFFDPETLAWRRVAYPTLAASASFVVVGTSWTRTDVAARMPALDPHRILVVPVPPTLDSPVGNWTQDRAVPWRAVYPAATWPHKNHERLIRATHLLTQLGFPMELWLPGPQLGPADSLDHLVRELKLEERVLRPGFIDETALWDLMTTSSLLIMPSLFESESIPIWEAFRFGLPVAASAVTAIPDQCGGAALLFDPYSVESIAEALRQLGEPGPTSLALSTLGKRRAAQFSLTDSATQFALLYELAFRGMLPDTSGPTKI